MRWLVSVVLLLAIVFAARCALTNVDMPPGPATPVAEPTDAIADAAAAGTSATPPATSAGAATGDSEPPIGSQPAPRDPSPLPPPADDASGAAFLVVDEADHPIGGATITAIDGERDLAAAVTDATGSARLAGAPERFAYRVLATGYWPVAAPANDAAATTRVVLPAAPRLIGRVFDAAGRAIGGARAVFLPAVAGRLVAPPALPPAVVPTTTDATGLFALPWPDANAHDLVVDARGFAPAVVPALQAAQLGGAPLVVRLDRGAAVAGTAVAANGLPLSHVRVEVWSPRTDSARRAGLELGPQKDWLDGQLLGASDTDPAGHFAVVELPVGNAVVALAVEHGAASQSARLFADAEVEVHLVALALASVRGHVPQPGCEVFVYGGPRLVRSVPVAPDGTFDFDDVPPGRYLIGAADPPIAQQLHAIVQQFLTSGTSAPAMLVELGPGEQRELLITAPRAMTGAVFGTATIGGQPATDHVVAIEAVEGIGAKRREAAVSASGAFRIEGVPAGDYDVRLRRRGESAVLAAVPCRVLAGDSIRITLVRP